MPSHICQVSDDESEAPDEAPQFLEQAPPSPNYMPGPEHPPSPDYMPSPEHPPSPDYVPGPEYSEYLVPFEDEAPIEDLPLPADASPTTLSSGYVADSDPEEDPEEDPLDYPTDRGDDDDEEESSRDDADDEDKDEASEDEDEEEEEHLAPADSPTLPAVDPVPLAEDTEAFEKDESTPTPPVPSPRLHRSRISIPSPPLPVPSPPLPLSSPPTHINPTYNEAPLGYRAAMIQ
ncbi:hypothetical protein Tco_1252536 [Tanacetum coccineum]